MSIFKNNAFDTASVGYVDHKASQSSSTSSPEIAISDTEPTEDSIELWIKKTGSGTKSLPEIKDDIINTTDTWSSTKINAEIEELKGMIGGGGYTSGVPYFTIIPNEYVDVTNNRGAFVAYNGWSRTDYLYCKEATEITFSRDIRYGSKFYAAYYTKDKAFLQNAELQSRTEGSNTTYYSQVPSGAEYIVVSSESVFFGTQITPFK